MSVAFPIVQRGSDGHIVAASLGERQKCVSVFDRGNRPIARFTSALPLGGSRLRNGMNAPRARQRTGRVAFGRTPKSLLEKGFHG
jgi:hypothetical protein